MPLPPFAALTGSGMRREPAARSARSRRRSAPGPPRSAPLRLRHLRQRPERDGEGSQLDWGEAGGRNSWASTGGSQENIWLRVLGEHLYRGGCQGNSNGPESGIYSWVVLALGVGDRVSLQPKGSMPAVLINQAVKAPRFLSRAIKEQ